MSTDLSTTILAKSDQLNSDDLIGGEITVRILGVTVGGTAEQPVTIEISGGHQPFKPCKTMRRVLVTAWGTDGKAYVGKSMTLYRDPNVKWAGEAVGGIRIKALSHISKPLEIALAESRKNKKKHVVAVLTDATAEWSQKISEADSLDALKSLGKKLADQKMPPADKASLREAYKARETELTTAPETDLNQRNDPAQAIRHEIVAAKSSGDRNQVNAVLEKIRDLFEDGNELREGTAGITQVQPVEVTVAVYEPIPATVKE